MRATAPKYAKGAQTTLDPDDPCQSQNTLLCQLLSNTQ